MGCKGGVLINVKISDQRIILKKGAGCFLRRVKKYFMSRRGRERPLWRLWVIIMN